MKKTKKLLLGVLCLIFAAVFIYSGYKVYTILRGYSAAEKRYDSLSDSVTAQGGDDAAKAGGSIASGTGREADPLYMDTSFITVDFDELAKISDYVIGWLYLPDSVINYPVAQYSDNDFFLNRFIDGNIQVGGALFADCGCPGDFSGNNTIIYGHHMRDGSMFASLGKYGEQEFYEANPIMYLYTPTQDYKLEIFSAFTTSDVSYVYNIFFPDENSFESHISSLRYMSDIKTDVEVGPEDHIVTLSTCDYSFNNARYVVIGKLVPIES